MPALSRSLRWAAFCLALAAGQASAGAVDTAACKRDLLVADSRAAQTRNTIMTRADADQTALCAAWRDYIDAARGAAGVYKRCLTGTDQRVRMAEMTTTAADFEDAVKSRCR